jgi:CBS domain-containing protein
MSLVGQAEQVWVYLGDNSKTGLQQTATVILDYLRQERIAGVTVLRGFAGYGPHSLARDDSTLAVSPDAPLVLTFVDKPDRVARVLPRIHALVQHGLITRTSVEVLKYTREIASAFPASLRVADVMTRDVVTIVPEADVDMIVGLLIDRALRALPVVDEQGRLQGMLTDGDLLARAGVLLPLPATPGTPAQDGPQAELGRTLHAHDLMTPNPVWVAATSPLADAASLLVTHDLKRLPVLDEQGRVVGMVSRGDLLGTVVGNRPAAEYRPAVRAAHPQRVAEVMVREVPTVLPNSSLTDVLDALMQARQRRVVVVDEGRHVIGIITDGDVLRRAARHVPASSAGGLGGWLRGGPRPATVELASSGLRARDVMTSPAHTVTADTAIPEATSRLLSHKVKRLPVVDEEGRLVGLIGRAGLLQALARTPAS